MSLAFICGVDDVVIELRRRLFNCNIAPVSRLLACYNSVAGYTCTLSLQAIFLVDVKVNRLCFVKLSFI